MPMLTESQVAFIEEWIRALETPGRYKQTKKALRRGDCFCALGVLCDLANPAAWQPSMRGAREYEDAIPYKVWSFDRWRYEFVILPDRLFSEVTGLTFYDELCIAETNDVSESDGFKDVAEYLKGRLKAIPA